MKPYSKQLQCFASSQLFPTRSSHAAFNHRDLKPKSVFSSLPSSSAQLVHSVWAHKKRIESVRFNGLTLSFLDTHPIISPPSSCFRWENVANGAVVLLSYCQSEKDCKGAGPDTMKPTDTAYHLSHYNQIFFDSNLNVFLINKLSE